MRRCRPPIWGRAEMSEKTMPDTQPPATPLLEVSGLDVYHGNSQTLKGMTLSVAPGEVVCLLGRTVRARRRRFGRSWG